MAQTLRTRLIARDAARFVGRADELARLDALLGDEPSASVVLLHGPPGVGKSALLRELARRGELGGMTPFEIEARDLAPLADALDEAIAPALRASRPLLLLDSWERLTALDAHLRRDLLPRLPFDALVVVASRRAPGPGWFGGGWENLVLDLALGPMDRAEAEALLAARGLSDPDLRAETVAWAGGSPLALVLAADAGGGGAGRTGRCSACRRRCAPAPAPRHPAGGRHAQRPAGRGARARHDSGPARRGAARRRCRACLPVAARASERGATPRGSDAPRPRRPSAAADLRRRSPELERDLRRRLVDTLYGRSMKEGLLQLTLDLQHLVQDPAIRWGFSWDSSGRPRIDTPRSGDFEGIAAGGGRAALGWLESARRYFDDAPDRVIVVRDQDDEIAGYGVGVTPANAPTLADDDEVLGPRLRHAAANVPSGAAVVWRQAVDLTHDRSGPVTALIGMAGVIGSGLDNPAAAYLPIIHGDPLAEAFSAACGAQPVAELEVDYGNVQLECHILDYGPGGLLAFQRAAVYRELGLAPPPPPPTFEAVREALRHYGSPGLLARCPLAPATGSPASRAAAVRKRIDDSAREAFGSSPEDELLHRVLVRGYLDPAPTHEVAADELNLSRAAYFRRLRTAVERVAAQLGAKAG